MSDAFVPRRRTVAAALFASLAVAATVSGPVPADAQSRKAQRSEPKRSEPVREPRGPLVAVVSIADQRMEVFDKDGLVTSTRVSTGKPGHGTPTGIFSIIQKKVQHTSNLYFAEMPFMQRITWSGVALHAGVVPGYPASHGCIRLPYAFARQFYGMTEMGMRVIVAPDEVEPSSFTHPGLFSPRPVDLEPLIARIGPRDRVASSVVAHAETGSVVTADARPRPSIPGVMRLGAPVIEDQSAQRPAPITASAVPASSDPSSPTEPSANLLQLRQQARGALTTANRVVASERQDLERVRNRHGSIVTQFSTLERTVERASGRLDAAWKAFARARNVRALDAAIDAERKAALQLADAAGKLGDIGPEAQAARAEVTAAADELRAAEANRDAAQALVAELDRMMKPVHVMVSRKTGKIYVRQGWEPILEAPVTISEPERPLGTHVYTVKTTSETAATWSVVSVDRREAARERRNAQRDSRNVDMPASGPDRALDRIVIPEDVRQRVSEMLSPGSSLIVSDEAPSSETGKGTDIIVLTR
jgi:hypothetical protein